MDEYREGQVKSTPVRGVKENLKPVAHKQSEGELIRGETGASLRGEDPDFHLEVGCLMACLLKNEPAS